MEKEKTILIIEDEPLLSSMYKERFKMAGFRVLTAMEAESGFNIAEKEHPDIVLLDILLPKESGISFLKRIKQDESLKMIPVVAFSNYDNPQVKKEALDLGAKDYLIKTSYTPQEIIEKVKSYL